MLKTIGCTDRISSPHDENFPSFDELLLSKKKFSVTQGLKLTEVNSQNAFFVPSNTLILLNNNAVVLRQITINGLIYLQAVAVKLVSSEENGFIVEGIHGNEIIFYEPILMLKELVGKYRSILKKRFLPIVNLEN